MSYYTSNYNQAQPVSVLHDALQFNRPQARWLSRDPLGEDVGTNLYAYCGGNPISRRDPSGLQGWEEVAGGYEAYQLLLLAAGATAIKAQQQVGNNTTIFPAPEQQGPETTAPTAPAWAPGWSPPGYSNPWVDTNPGGYPSSGPINVQPGGFMPNNGGIPTTVYATPEEESAKLMQDPGIIISGPGSGRKGKPDTPLQQAARLAAEYGGQPGDWVKKTSKSMTLPCGQKVQQHWFENTKTGQQIQRKTTINR